MKDRIILYQEDDRNINVNVYYKDETYWLTQKSMAELFDVNTQAITKHLSNIYSDGELDKISTCSKMEQLQIEGSRTVQRTLEFYNLNAINTI